MALHDVMQVLEAGSQYVFRAAAIDAGASFSIGSLPGASSVGTLPLSGSAGDTYILTIPRDLNGTTLLTFSSPTATANLTVEHTCSPLCRAAYLSNGVCDAVCNTAACAFDTLPPRRAGCADDVLYTEGGFTCSDWTQCGHAADMGINQARLQWSCPASCGTCSMYTPTSDCANMPSVTYLVSGGGADAQNFYTFTLQDHVSLPSVPLASGSTYFFIANGVNESVPFMVGTSRGNYVAALNGTLSATQTPQMRVLATTQGPLTGTSGMIAFNTPEMNEGGSFVYYATTQPDSTFGPVPVTPRVFTIVSGGQHCHTTIDGLCVTDDPQGSTGNYGNNERCSILMNAAATLTATDFNTESGFDFLYVRTARYSGTRGPTGVAVAPGDTLAWTSDGSVIRSGSPRPRMDPRA
jgi:hypothetical protein